MARRSAVATPLEIDGAGDVARGVFSVAEAIETVSEQFGAIYQIEILADKVGEVSSAVGRLANAALLTIIAQHGNHEDRNKVVEYVKRHFDGEFD
jgi:hypothetical protein